MQNFTFNFTPSGATYLITPSPFPNPSGQPVYGGALAGALNITLADNNGVLHVDAPSGYSYDGSDPHHYTFAPIISIVNGELLVARLNLDSERYIQFFPQYHDLVRADFGGVITVLAPVPETETWTMMLVGAGLLASRRRIRVARSV